MLTLVQAIARMEGFGLNPANLPTRHNNPGDLMAGQFANAHGAIPSAPDPLYPKNGPSRYAVFPSALDGWDALRWLLVGHYAGLSLDEAINRYAPPSENNTASYIAWVCKWTGMTPATILAPGNIG